MSITQGTTDTILYNPGNLPGNLPGEDVWEPEPDTIAELYKKIEKDQIIELEWRCSGRVVHEEPEPTYETNTVQEPAVDEVKLKEKQRMLSMFDADDIANKVNTPPTLNKTPKVPKSSSKAKAKASFDKIFSKVSHQATTDNTNT